MARRRNCKLVEVFIDHGGRVAAERDFLGDLAALGILVTLGLLSLLGVLAALRVLGLLGLLGRNV